MVESFSRDGGEKAREEFFSEAQELVDGLGRDLLGLDDLLRHGKSDPEGVNDIFRAVHTLKGLAGLFGAALMTGLSHQLEEVLDDLRLGRIQLSPFVLDLLFRGVELYGRILAAERDGLPEPAEDVKALVVSLGEATQEVPGAGTSPVARYELDPGLLGVLTEYEEHRLRTNIQSGLTLYRLRVQFALATIDSALDELKAKARPYGEIITYLPTGAGEDADSIELEILLASAASLQTLTFAVASATIQVEEVQRRTGPVTVTPPSMPLTPSPPLTGPPLATTHVVAPGAAPPPVPPESSSALPVPDSPSRGYEAATAHRGEGLSPEVSLRSVSQTVRVDIRKLDNLMNIVGELAIVRTTLSRLSERMRGQAELRVVSGEMHRLYRSFERNLALMQSGILEVRMVPLGQAFDKLARIVRQISREHGKDVNLVVTGSETEIDKLIVEELSDPLMHMIRNAIDHGIETREERERVGKPPVGTIALNAFQKGNQVLIEVEDDGQGMRPDVLVEAAVRKGLLRAEEASELSPREIFSLVFIPGFTTKTEATDISGRGVGMDIVKTNIAKLGGIVDITSEVGIGTKMTVTLPITLAIISVLVVDVAGRTFAIPLASVDEAIVFAHGDLRAVEGREVMTQRGKTLPICRLNRFFGFETDLARQRAAQGKAQAKGKAFVVIVSVGVRRVGFVVDRLIGQEDIVIKALGNSLKQVRGFAGATELGDQRVALVLDAAAIVDEVLAADKDRYPFEPRLEPKSEAKPELEGRGRHGRSRAETR